MSVALSLDFINTETLDARITASGGANGTRVNSSGLIVTASAPRYDYYPVSKAPRGLMREPARANLFTYSNTFDNAAWGNAGNTITPAAATSPDGTLNGYKIATNSAGQSMQRTINFTGDGVKSLSFWLMAGSGSPALRIRDATAANVERLRVNITWSGGVPSVSMAVGTLQAVTAFLGGWYLIQVQTTTITAANTNNFLFYPANTGGTGDVYVYGGQAEDGAFCTSYIPTTSASVTRSLDTFVMTGTNFSNWFNSSEGTFFAEWEEGGDGTTAMTVTSANDSTVNNNIAVKRQNNTLLREQVAVSGSVVCAAGQSSTFVAGQFIRTAAAYKLNDFSFSANGQAVSTDTAGAIPTVSQLNLGQEPDGSNSFCGHFRWIIYDNTRVVDASLVADSAFNIGSITGAATVAGGGLAVFTSVGTITGAATVSSTGRALFPSIGSSTGVGVATGIGLFPQTSIGTSAGAATVSGVGLRIFLGVGSSVGAGVASGVGQNIFPSPGTIVGAATVTGIGAFGVPGVGTIIGAATVLGAGTELFPSVGFSEGASIVFANGQWGVARAAHIDGAALVFGVGADGHTVPSDRSFRIPIQRRSIAVSD